MSVGRGGFVSWVAVDSSALSLTERRDEVVGHHGVEPVAHRVRRVIGEGRLVALGLEPVANEQRVLAFCWCCTL